MKKDWWKDSVVYQVYPRSFQDSNGDGIGDLQGIISRLDYIKQLGADVIWICPIYPSPNVDYGYDVTDHKTVMESYGTMEDFHELLEEVHKRGLKLVMDFVLNHTSTEHAWFKEAELDKTSKYRNFYFWRPGTKHGPPTDWQSDYGQSVWQYEEHTGEYYLHMNAVKQADLNWENEDVRQAVYEMMRFWLDKGVDGLRIDQLHLISKKEYLPSYEDYVQGKAESKPFQPNGRRIHDYLTEMTEEVFSQYDVMSVGEAGTVTPEEGLTYTGTDEHELNMIFHFQHMELDQQPGKEHWDLKPLELSDLKSVLTKWQKKLENKGWNTLFWCNHDQPRIVSRFGDEGKYRKESAKMLASVLYLMKGTPYIYQGEELGMTNAPFTRIEDYKDIQTVNMYHKRVYEKGYDPKEVMTSILAKSRDHARTPMQWNDGKHAGFTDGTPWLKVNPNYTSINAAEALADPDSILSYYKKLISLRKQYADLMKGSYDLLLPDDPQLFVYIRQTDTRQLLVINNFSDKEAIFQWPDELQRETAQLLLSNYDGGREALPSIELKPFESRVYLLKRD
ncbi:glycoside hydrolase family 13 protein [Bacillus atrophaeus]|uniref:glycoside hydrolase family 13 protein n=1 Tax=Bacillus atrophaeus TaxID=1452 RepID=UPI0022809EE4|nr:alpha-glucosidase [Bacillus atrophaeus]MCY8491312.1 alpha-glucosidase [Bacillus atrophaeus]MCY8817368.1 alpha-glucosidase [Bacillus atrophaeus]